MAEPPHNLDITIRELIGVDPQLVEEHFKAFLHAHPQLTAKQVKFMNLLKKHIATHGSIQIETLYEQPFTSVSHEGIDGVFDSADVDDLIAVLKPFIPNQQPTSGLN